jgi:hypothetical protein
MAAQIRAVAATVAAEVQAAQTAQAAKADQAGASSSSGSGSEPSTTDPEVSGSVSLVIMGRQYVPGLRALWEDTEGIMWRDLMRPIGDDEARADALANAGAEERAAMMAKAGGEAWQDKREPDLYQGEILDPDVEQGGSRPVGQVNKKFGDLLRNAKKTKRGSTEES